MIFYLAAAAISIGVHFAFLSANWIKTPDRKIETSFKKGVHSVEISLSTPVIPTPPQKEKAPENSPVEPKKTEPIKPKKIEPIKPVIKAPEPEPIIEVKKDKPIAEPEIEKEPIEVHETVLPEKTDLSENSNQATESTELPSVEKVAEETTAAKNGSTKPIGVRSSIKSEIRLVYPRISRIRGEEGVVTIESIIDADGKLVEAKVLKSSGFERLDEAALKAIKKAKFNPASENGKSVESTLISNLNFKLH